MMKRLTVWASPVLIVLIGLGLGGCASAPSDPEDRADFEAKNDPAEPTNRAIFDANMAFDRSLFKPVALAYQDNVPTPAQNGLRNAFSNLGEPVIAFNDLLQANPSRAWDAVVRFVLNSTIGMAGLLDPAGDFGIKHHDADYGQTFAVWGIGEGPYIELPLFGPSNVRDTAGLLLTFASDPLTWVVGPPVLFSMSRGADVAIDTRARQNGALEDLQKNSFDYYATLRSAYRQRRNSLVEDAKNDNGRTDHKIDIDKPAATP
jgi:phospholipid-binding lipoprotein MlaA